MSEFVAPLKDMRFVLHELADLETVNGLPGYEDSSAELVDAILEEAGKFASGVLAPLNASGDRMGSKCNDGAVTTPDGFADAYKQFVAGGWNGLSSDPEFGGQGLPTLVATPAQEMFHAANLSFTLCPMLGQGAVEALVQTGSEELKARFLHKMVDGEWTGTMNLTEPQAGSDLAQVRTKAEPQGDHYLITGQKIFITYGDQDWTDNIVHLVLARTPDAPAGVKGISMFVVPKFLLNENGEAGERNSGARCASIEEKMGIHASPTAVMAYENAVGYLVGEENRGLEYMFIMMNRARFAVGLEGLGIAERAYQQAVDYARQRIQGREIGVRGGSSVAIIHHPDVRRMLMSMRARVEAMRAVAFVVAGALDKANRHPDEAERQRNQAFVDLMIPVVKGWDTEMGVEVSSTGVQVHGGMGFIEETGAAQHYRDARITTIYEGTTGIQANDLIGRKIAHDKGRAVGALLQSMRATVEELSGAGGQHLEVIRTRLTTAVDAASGAVDWLLDTYGENPAVAAASAVPFLHLMGVATGGWQMARAALAAQRHLDSGDGDTDFYQSKIVTARFFADHELTRAPGLADAVTTGAPGTLELDEAQF